MGVDDGEAGGDLLGDLVSDAAVLGRSGGVVVEHPLNDIAGVLDANGAEQRMAVLQILIDVLQDGGGHHVLAVGAAHDGGKGLLGLGCVHGVNDLLPKLVLRLGQHPITPLPQSVRIHLLADGSGILPYLVRQRPAKTLPGGYLGNLVAGLIGFGNGSAQFLCVGDLYRHIRSSLSLPQRLKCAGHKLFHRCPAIRVSFRFLLLAHRHMDGHLRPIQQPLEHQPPTGLAGQAL